MPAFRHGGAPIPQAALVGPLLTSSGVNGMDPDTGKVPPDLEDQVRLIFENIERILQAARGSPEDIAKCVFYVRDRASRAAIDPLWMRMFPDPQSLALHTLQHELPGPLLVQCELTAYIDRTAQ